ncbi:MAG: restriction endonuclease subunit S [Ruminococcus sp.]|nr:restriction endonuclease subunit S [Ruminococcus sp.]
MREMKDSGVEWVGKIPEYWKIVKVKYVISITNGSEPLTESGDTSVYGSGSKSFRTCEEYKQGSAVLLGRKGTINIPQWIEGKYWNIDTAFDAKSKSKDINLKLYYYFSVCFDYEKYATQTAIPSMKQSDYNNMKIPLPPIEEQNKIVSYLDRKCAEIEKIIELKNQQIDLLKEYRKTLISETVTKGLNKKVKLKDSGVSWVGEIPEHWSVHPVYYYFGERKNKNSSGLEKNLLSLSYGKIVRKNINSNNGLMPENFDTYNIIEKNDIIIRPTDLQNDQKSLRTAISEEHGIITSAYIALKPVRNINAGYFHYLLHTYDVMKVFYNMGNGIRQSMNFSEFSQLIVFEPPLSEQEEISAYLDKKCTEIEKIIDLKNQQINLLHEYKKTLIYEYVTGKQEV